MAIAPIPIAPASERKFLLKIANEEQITKGNEFASPYINPFKPPLIFPKILGIGLFERSSNVFSLIKSSL